jgi:hypothetical protein
VQKPVTAQVEQTVGKEDTTMGDKSPKATHKQASQKQAKAASANQKKQQAGAAKQSVISKK